VQGQTLLINYFTDSFMLSPSLKLCDETIQSVKKRLFNAIFSHPLKNERRCQLMFVRSGGAVGTDKEDFFTCHGNWRVVFVVDFYLSRAHENGKP